MLDTDTADIPTWCRDEAFEALSQFVLALEVAAFDGDAALRHGAVRASLASRGTPIGRSTH